MNKNQSSGQRGEKGLLDHRTFLTFPPRFWHILALYSVLDDSSLG